MLKSKLALAGAILFVVLLGARVLGAHYVYFWEGDEMSLAAGIAALVRDNGGDMYRYGPQVGYHRLVELLDLLLGGDPARIPTIMITLSAVAGAVIPVAGLASFRADLTSTERWLLAWVLAINPILWMSSAYGGSAMPSVAVATVGLALLSNRPGPKYEVLALLLFALGILIRADAVLLTPAVAFLLHLRHRSLGAVAMRIAIVGFSLVVVYGLLFVFDPRMADFASSMREHLTNPGFTTRFWEYLLWALGPIPALFAVWGIRNLVDERRHLLWAVLLWCLPVFGFYFASTTTPRYFLLVLLPISLCGAVGMSRLARDLAPLLRARAAQAAVLVAASLHLFIGLGHFTPGGPGNLLWESSFETHDGPMWTGAYLYKTYLDPTPLARFRTGGGFGQRVWLAQGFEATLAEAAARRLQGRTVVVLLKNWNGHVFYYNVQVAGATFISRRPGMPFLVETRMELGGATLISFHVGGRDYAELSTLPVQEGDEVWMMTSRGEQPDLAFRERLAPGLGVVAVGDSTLSLRRFRVLQAQSAGTLPTP